MSVQAVTPYVTNASNTRLRMTLGPSFFGDRHLNERQHYRLDTLPEETKVVGWYVGTKNDPEVAGPIVRHPSGALRWVTRGGLLRRVM